jgi:hypothetical protein
MAMFNAAEQCQAWAFFTIRDHPELFAVYCALEGGTPWALGLIDDDFADNPGPWGRHAVMLATPALTVDDLPAQRAQWTDHSSEHGVCLSVDHFTGLSCTLLSHPDGSGSLALDATENLGVGILRLHVPYALVTEYLTCLSLDPTTWHERPSWVRNPRPVERLWRAECDERDAAHRAWFLHVRETLLAACARAFPQQE